MGRQGLARASAITLALVWSAACGSETTPSQTPPVTGAPTGSVTPAPFGGGAAGSAPITPVVTPPARPTATAGTGAITPPPPAATAGTASVTPVPTENPAVPVSNKILPCNVNKALATNCGMCHGATPIGGAPMSLLTWDDFQKPAKTNPSMKVADVVKLRINDMMRPMPPGGGMAPTDLAMMNTWLTGGATAGTDADKACVVEAPKPAEGLTFGALTPLPGEVCYDFPVHQGQTAADKTPYNVPVGEHYVQFYHDAPWPTGSLGVRYGARYQNQKVIHHWLMFSTTEFDAGGSWHTAPLPTLLGVNAQLIAGWAVGGANMVMPEDVGFELPPKGSKIDIQWHYYNSGTRTETDASAVQVCTVPPGGRKNVAGITWVGTEDLNGNVWFGGAGMPAKKVSNFQGTCNPLRAKMNATDPIKIIGFWPHMHQLGTRMQAVINRKGGMKETVFDKPFDFNKQIHYLQNHDLNPGDTLTAICTFNNTTDRGVPFGESSDTEMCYNFVMSYPAHGLENGIISLIGATNTCW